jgi:DNA-binding transcriptional LysR family regulator
VEVRELRVFVAVVDEGGLSAAARRLHLSQSSVSDTVRSLERQLRVPLLVRTRAGAAPTEAGQVLAVGARKLLRAHDRLEMELSDRSGASGTARLGAPMELPASFLSEVTATVAATHPQVHVEVRHESSRSQWASLRGDHLDIGLVRELEPDDEFDSLLVVQEALGVVVAAARAEELTTPHGEVALDRLAALRWNGFSRSDAPAWHDHVAATMRGHGIRVPRQSPSESRPVTPEVKFAAVGHGSAFALAGPTLPIPKGLVWLPLAGRPLIRRTWAVWRADTSRRDIAAVVAALEHHSVRA